MNVKIKVIHLAEKCCRSTVQEVIVTGTVSNIFICRPNTWSLKIILLFTYSVKSCA